MYSQQCSTSTLKTHALACFCVAHSVSTHLPAANAKQEAHDIALLLLLKLLEILVGTHLWPQLVNASV